MHLAARHRPGKPKAAWRWKKGAFNLCYVVRYEDGFEAIVRFTALERVIFRTEKVENEVAVMNNLRQNTKVPIPEVFGPGNCWGSFIERNIPPAACPVRWCGIICRRSTVEGRSRFIAMLSALQMFLSTWKTCQRYHGKKPSKLWRRRRYRLMATGGVRIEYLIL